MTAEQPTVFIVLQQNEETRPVVDAIIIDNPGAVVERQPAMVKINVPGRLVVRRETIEEEIGRPYDLREMHVNLITLTGNVDESDDEFILSWT